MSRLDNGGKGLPLTFRLMVALLAGSLFVATVVSYLAAGVERDHRVEERTTEVREFAKSLAGRAAPLLERQDDLRLAMLCASVAEMSGSRILVLDRAGVVRLDTGMTLGSKRLQLLTMQGPFVRDSENGLVEQLVPAHGLHGMVGEIRVRYPELREELPAFSWPVFGGAFLMALSLVVIACGICHHWMLHAREMVATAAAFNRGDVLARCRRHSGGVLRELADELHSLGSVVDEGNYDARRSFLELAERCIEMLERDRHEGHADRTGRYVAILAQRLGLSAEEARDLDLAARLHDLGDLFVRPQLLESEGPLNAADRESLRNASQRGSDLLAAQPSLRRVAEILRYRCEKYDGSGYPDQLRGDRIPLGARVVAIAEAYDQWTTCSIRGHCLSWSEALERMQEERGDRFDPWLLDLFDEEIHKHPLPEGTMNQVTISRDGVLPYLAADDPDTLVDVAAETEAESLAWGDGDLDVLEGDAVEEDRG